MAQSAEVTQLKPPTLLAFEAYTRDAQAEADKTMCGEGSFLWSDLVAERARQVRSGQIVAEFWSGKGPLKAPDALIHDWIAAAFIPGGNLQRTLRLMQDYDNHKNVYKPEVMDSKLITRDGDDFEIYLRLLKKKIMTVVLDTDHDVHYEAIDERRWLCRSFTTRVSEVHEAGKANESISPPDAGYGFLWRMNTHWRLYEADEGIFIECRAISLTRDIPTGLGWIIEPIVKKLPRESLVNTLKATRQALAVASG
jgi:hypothetical protein